MTNVLKKNNYLQAFQLFASLSNIKYRAPIIMKMYATLNNLDLRNENRYILCNFIDQNSDLIKYNEDIYMTNHKKSLNQLFLLAFNKARENDMLDVLYDGYRDSIQAISQKIEFNH